MSKARCNRVIAGALSLIAGAAVGCGGASHHAADAGTHGAAGLTGTAGKAGGTAGTAAPMITPLPAHTAGKSCSANSECGPGMCATQVTGTNLLAGPMSAPGGYCSGPCLTDSDCGQGGTCIGAIPAFAGFTMAVAGECQATCQTNSDCRDGYRCVMGLGLALPGATGTTGDAGTPATPGTCQPSPPTDKLDDGVAGAMCSADADCSHGTCLTMTMGAFGGAGTAYPGGYCTGRCLEAADCGQGGVCTPGFAGGTGNCVRGCSSDSDCGRDGYRCRTVAMAVMGCAPGNPPLGDNVAGNACSANSDCGGGTCAMRLAGGTGVGAFFGTMLAAPGGYCTASCVDNTDCGAGAVCIGGQGGTAASGTCMKTCTMNGDECRTDYSCQQRGGGFFGGMTSNVCAPAPPPPPENDAGF